MVQGTMEKDPERVMAPRAGDAGQRAGNRLRDEGSTYLRQHAHNPVDWYPWGTEALDRAREQDRPIFLSIGYSACHWCHVMETDCFEDGEVAARLNQHFVAIKVDREERPDLDQVYMDAVVALTGSGGWPMSLFLTPDLKPFYAGTYFPRHVFLQLLDGVHNAYRTRRQEIEIQAYRVFQHVAQGLPPETPAGLEGYLPDQLIEASLAQVDPRWGGFGSRMKFPMPVHWSSLLHLYRKTLDPRLARLIQDSLRHMAEGGIQDHLAGGFHRYAIEPTWLVPHFEKMLYDNALLAPLYTEAAVVFRDGFFEAVARHTLDFMLRDMRDAAGVFYSSVDADSEGREGSVYLWTPDELVQAAGGQAGPLLADLLGVTPQGNFAGKSILTRRVAPQEVAARHGRPVNEVAGLLDRFRERLLHFRKARVQPGLDRKVVSAWNGLVISALARAGSALGESRYLDAARRASEVLWNTHRDRRGRLWRASNHGQVAHRGVLDDYAFYSLGLLDLFSATSEPIHLRRALDLFRIVQSGFRNDSGAYFFTIDGADAPLGRQVIWRDQVLPSGNSVMLHVRLELAALTGDDALRREVRADLEAHSGMMRRLGLEMIGWWDAALMWTGPSCQVVLAGDDHDPSTGRLSAAFERMHPAHAILIRVPAGGAGEDLAALVPVVRGKSALRGRATAYVCGAGGCLTPVQDGDELASQIQTGWPH